MIKKTLIMGLIFFTSGVTQPKVVYDVSYKEARCLAEAIWQEARGESKLGQRAVAQVVLNRVDQIQWPGSICKVVFQPYQFSWSIVWTGWQHDRTSWILAKEVLKNNKAIPDFTATHFHAGYVRPRWSTKLKKLAKIGNHIFYA